MTLITIFTSGSRGDVQPYVGLGVGLKAAGYDVRLLATENFETLATGAGLDFASTGTSVEELIQTDEWRETMERGNFLAILRKMQAEVKKAAEVQAEILPALLRGSDLLLTGMAGMGGAFSAAEKFGIPLVQAYVVPFAPTKAFASPVMPPALRLGGAVNRVSFQVMRQLFWQNTKAADAAIRRALGMKPGSFLGPFRSLEQQGIPAMYGYSRHVLPQPADWGAHHRVTGYWFLGEPDDWTPPADLANFLEAGAPPVYIGFGSMGSRNPEEAGRIALEALAQSGQRGVLAAGWGGLQAADLPDTVHIVSSIPHSWLFPRMAAVVHHGGAGTTSAGLRAGVPSILVPFSLDQPFWGQRVAELGVGPESIPRKQLTAEKLAQAIAQAVTDEEMREAAAALGRKIEAEDGIGAAVAFIEGFADVRIARGA